MAKPALNASQRLALFARVERDGASVVQACNEFGISRFTYYKWKKRWEKNRRSFGALRDTKPHLDRSGLRVRPKDVNAILSLVVEFPNLSKYQLANKFAERIGPSVGVHGIYNVLRRHGLNTQEARFAYAEGFYHPPAKAELGIGQKITYSWNRLLRNLIPLPLPAFSFYTKFVFYLVFGVGIAFATVYSFTWWINHLIAKTPTVALGTVFTTIALGAGTVFFLYSLKYYLSLAIVLSFSQQPSLAKATEGKRRGFLSWILGITNGRGKAGLITEASAKAVGLTPNLEHVTLERYPKVSVHIPLYNEKTVVERILNAVTSFEYPTWPAGGYEVIIADDSTDSTTSIIENYLRSQNTEIKTQRGEGWMLTETEIRQGVVLKHLHRTSRSGFKGGALREALKHTDPKVEFVTVFDADFVPYPDTLELFLKYFKVQNSMSEDYTQSKVAAVQGYQWHVLNKSENWITRGVRSEYAGSYVIERSGAEIYTGLKQISGAVYMIRRDVLEEIGWQTSITEDFELTLRLYAQGYKVVYTPYIQAPAECVSTLKRLIRQRMRWAEGHSNNIKKMFTKLMFNPKLTLSEKLEFAYLSPYYLQAFFFLIGTLSWLISETLFPARLPFWTSLWGWSLVLTNFLSLPLMNAVGLFLEESEEKDYIGLTSFAVLSYVLVPFQAYASLKGFIEREEGPWFRTPKTGRITDIIRRGTFYRLIAGILPGRSATSVERIGSFNLNAKRSPLNAYLSLATANSRFESFNVTSKKVPWLGKTFLVVLLVISITVLSLSSFIEINNPVDMRLNLPKITSEKRSFAVDEQPSFILDIGENRTTGSKSLISDVEAYEELEIETSIYFNREKIDMPLDIEKLPDGKLKLKVEPSGSIQPGKYEVKAVINQGKESVIASESFVWGVLAINTNKSIYLSGETAYLQFSALNDQGSTLCKAPLELRINSPKGDEKILSTKESTISFSEKCNGNNVTDEPDYLSYLKVEELGTYEITLRNQDNGYEISDKLEVVKSVPFDIERVGATRINPYEAEYLMRIKIKANEDFEGRVIERVPVSFAINKNRAFSVERLGEVQKIVWEVDLKGGETYEFSYTYQAPKKSPKVYLLGPLELADSSERLVFREARLWQLASDAALLTKTTTFTANSGTGNQSVTGVGFKPKAILFWITDRTSAGSGAVARLGQGWTDCTNEGAQSVAWSDGSSSSSVNNRPSNTKVITLINDAGTVLAEADIVSCDSDGFTISWSTAGGSRIVGYTALAGSSLTNVKAGSKTDVNPPIGSNISVTGVGFQPDAVFMMGHELGTFDTSNGRGQGTFGIGVSSTNRHAAGWRQRCQVGGDTNCITVYGSSGTNSQGMFIPADDGNTPEFSIDLVSMDSGGFTYIYDVGSSDRSIPILYLALKGMSIARGVLTQPTSTGNQSVTGLSFQPSVVLFGGGDKATTDGFEQNAEYVTGAATSSTARFGIWIGNGDPTGATSISDTDLSTSAVIRSLSAGTPTVNAVADFVSMDSGGFTINWSTADATARKIGWVALGPAGSELVQIHYRWRNDDGSQSTATWAKAEDTKFTNFPQTTTYRLRFEVSNEGGLSSGAKTYQLQVAETATCSSGTYAAVPTDTTGDWQIVDSTNLTDGGATTNVASGLTDEATTFVAGQVKDTGDTTGNITLASDNFTEIEYSLQATANSTIDGNYCFRLTNIDNYSIYAEAVVVPEYTWIFFGLGPFLPRIISKIKRKKRL